MMENKLRALWVSIALLALILGLLLGAAIAAPRTRAEMAAIEADKITEQYYRGGYDVCKVFAALYFAPADVPRACRDAVKTTFDNDWYGQESGEWVWPLP